jgi:hypothetical protein
MVSSFKSSYHSTAYDLENNGVVNIPFDYLRFILWREHAQLCVRFRICLIYRTAENVSENVLKIGVLVVVVAFTTTSSEC